jgi:hypothetical protein
VWPRTRLIAFKLSALGSMWDSTVEFFPCQEIILIHEKIFALIPGFR